jgi:hypothetical protein
MATRIGLNKENSHEINLPDNNSVVPRGVLNQGNLQTSNRFLLNVRGVDVAFITSVSRPSYTIATEDSKLLNWSFSYPTSITWDSISFSVREVFDGYNFQTILGMLYKKLTDYGWNTPDFKNPFGYVDNDLAKQSLVESLGPIQIKTLDDQGRDIEIWTLHGAFITSVKPSQLTYEQDGLTNIDVTVKFDYATLDVVYGSQVYGR